MQFHTMILFGKLAFDSGGLWDLVSQFIVKIRGLSRNLEFHCKLYVDLKNRRNGLDMDENSSALRLFFHLKFDYLRVVKTTLSFSVGVE